MIKFAKFIFLTLSFILIFGLFSVEIKDPDFWWHLKSGQYIYETGSIPKTDPFAYTSLPKDPLNPESKRIRFILSQYWLSQVIFYKIFTHLGSQGIIYFRALLLTLIIFLIYRSLRRECLGTYLSLILTAPGVIVFYSYAGERPQLFSFLFAFLFIYLLEGFRKTSSKITPHNPPLLRWEFKGNTLLRGTLAMSLHILPIPFIMLAWANLHGGYIMGIAILLGYLFSEGIKNFRKKSINKLASPALRLFAVISLLSILLSFINPNTYKVFPFLIEFEKGFYKTMIVESMSPYTLIRSGFTEIQLKIYFLLLIAGILVVLANIKRDDMTDIVIFSGLSLMSLSSSRFIPFFIPFAMIIITRYGVKRLEDYLMNKRVMILIKKAETIIPIILSVLLIIALNNSDLFKHGVRKNVYPEGAANFLKENKISGNMFNPYTWGGYLMWELYPDYKVFIDGRGLISEVFFQAVKIMEASPKKLGDLPEWRAYLNAYNVNFIITYSVGNFSGRLVPLIPAILNDPQWHLVYMDSISLIFIKDTAENAGIIGRHGLPKEWLWNEVAVEAALKAKVYRNNINYYITIGDAFYAKRSYRESKQAYQKALKVDPYNTTANKRLNLLKALGY
jgi:hypothetical protein